jgi:hypothetical protein
MTAAVQSFIADFLRKRGFRDYSQFATDGAEAIESRCEKHGWSQSEIVAALSAVKTSLFMVNRGERKKDVLNALAERICSKVAKPTVGATESRLCRILFLAANPLTTDRLLLDEELRAVQKNVRASPGWESISLETAHAVRPDDILQRLNEVDPHVLHFSGHGSDTQGIVLSDGSCGEAVLSSSAIDHLFNAMKGKLKLVVLNACFSELQAKQIVKHVDFVIGMNDSVDDDAAAVFAAAFYRALGFGKSIKNAFDQGVAAIALQNLTGHDIPVLLCKSGQDSDREFVL